VAIAIALVGARGSNGGTSTTTTAGTTAASGSTFLIAISHGAAQGNPLTVTDNKGNTFSKVGLTYGSSGGARELWIAENGTGGASHTATVTFASGEATTIYLLEITGASSPGVDAATGRDNVTTHDLVITVPASGNFAQADELLVAIVGASDGGTVVYSDTSATWTKVSEEQDGNTFWSSAVFSRVIGAITPIVTAFSNNNPAGSFLSGPVISIKQAAAGGGVTATLNITDDSDTTIATASIASTAAFSTSDALDTLSSDGTVVTPDGVFQPGFQPGFQGVSGGGGGGVTATLSLTDAGDSVSASVGVAISSILSRTDTLDTVSSGASIGISATANLSDATDSVVGASTPAIGVSGKDIDLQTLGTDPQQVTLNTQVSGSAFVVVQSTLGGAGDPTDNKGNTLSRILAATPYTLFPSFVVEAFAKTNGVGGTSHIFSATKEPGRPDEEATMFVAEILNGLSIQDIQVTQIASGGTMTSAAVTATGPAVILQYWWGDNGDGPHTAVPNNGFTVIQDSLSVVSGGIQGAMATRTVTAGTYQTTWTATPTQGAILVSIVVQGGAGNANASVSVVGVLSQTDAADTLVGQGSVPVSGAVATLSQTDAIDTLASTVSASISGVSSFSDGVDALSGIAAVSVVSSLSQVDVQDQASSAANIDVVSTLSRTDTQDSLISGAATSVAAALTQADATDSLGAGAAISVDALLAQTDAMDTLAASGLVSIAGTISGTFSQTDSADTISASGVVLVSAGSNIQDQLDTLGSGGSIGIVGSLSSTDALDTLASGGTVTVAGAITATLVMLDGADILSAGGVVSVAAAFAQSDAIDSAIANGSIFTVGTFSQTDLSDTLIAAGVHFVPGRKLKPRPDSAVRVNVVTSKVIGVTTTQGVISNATTTAIGEPQP
jgi:hypothetical protein